MGNIRRSDFEILVENLNYPESPVWMGDGTVVVCEAGSGLLRRFDAASGKETAQPIDLTGGDPNTSAGANGAALGPDGALYVCDDGGFTIVEIPGTDVRLTVAPSQKYRGGSIKRVDPGSGKVETIFTSFEAPVIPGLQQTKPFPLQAPDDLIFDCAGNFWFTDWGMPRPVERVRDVTGIYYADPKNRTIKEIVWPLSAPNGIALSPKGDRLYVSETYTRRVLYWELSGQGQIKKNPKTELADGSYLLSAHLRGEAILDSMKVDSEGNVYVATMLPEGPDPNSNGGITVLSPKGEELDFIEIQLPGKFAPLPSNLCFGGPDRRTAFITLGGTGRLVKCEMSIPGLALNFNPY